MFLGRRCYGLYIWHVLAAALAVAALKHWDVGFYAHLVLWLAILLTMASVSWLYFEKPILRFKRFLPYTERGVRAAVIPNSGLIRVSR